MPIGNALSKTAEYDQTAGRLKRWNAISAVIIGCAKSFMPTRKFTDVNCHAVLSCARKTPMHTSAQGPAAPPRMLRKRSIEVGNGSPVVPNAKPSIGAIMSGFRVSNLVKST